MKRWTTLELNGRLFELDTKNTAEYPNKLSYRDVNDCYGRCSDAKKAIWDNWSAWFFGHEGYCEVASYNCMMFTIDGYVTDQRTGKVYRCYITKAHNYATEISA